MLRVGGQLPTERMGLTERDISDIPISMRTADGFDIPWRYSDAPGTTLTQEQLLALTSPDACARAIAHADLTRGQISRLYRNTKALAKLGARRRLLGKRILASGLSDYCVGIGEGKLMKVFGPSGPDERRGRIAMLLSFS